MKPKPKTTRNYAQSPKLSGKQVRQIRELWESGKCQDYELLAWMFDVSDWTIRKIVSGEIHHSTYLLEEKIVEDEPIDFLDSWSSSWSTYDVRLQER